jgi:hypothetical protein
MSARNAARVSQNIALVCLTMFAGIAGGQEPPNAEQQPRILQTVTEFARGYLDRLPDFICIRTTQHFLAKANTKDWHPQVKVAYELSYFGHDEHYRIVAVDDVQKKKVPMWTMAAGWVETNGNFGRIMSELFDPKIHPNFQWQSWDYVHGKRAMVFSYHVPLAESHTSSGRCVNWIVFNACKSLKYAYHGLLYVDHESLDIVRITHVPEDLPKSYVQGTTSVDYGRVTVAGNEYLLPIADRVEDNTGKTLFSNESSYGDYRKFVSESALKTTVAPVPEGAPGRPTGKAPPQEAQPLQVAQCFEARDGAARRNPSAIASAMVASAFDDRRTAERELLAVVRRDPDSDEAKLAHAELARVLERSGHVREAQKHAAQASAGDPSINGREQAPGLLEALAKYPPQSIAARGYSRLPLVQGEDALAIVLSINGKASQFLIDTGAEISSILESHAKALGMTIHDDRFSITDIAGKEVPCRLALANELVAGKFRLRNVPFCVLPEGRLDTADSLDTAPDILGLPVLLSFETVRWSRGGSFEFGFPSAHKNIVRSNVCFEGGGLVVQVDLGQRHPAFNLDTGNAQTFLYPDFAEDFADVAKGAGAKEVYEMKGLGEGIELEAGEIPELKLRFAGGDTVLHEVPMLVEPLPSQCPGCSGNAGRDLLIQARILTLDFKAMKLTVGR